jgi:hypothetical protein
MQWSVVAVSALGGGIVTAAVAALLTRQRRGPSGSNSDVPGPAAAQPVRWVSAWAGSRWGLRNAGVEPADEVTMTVRVAGQERTVRRRRVAPADGIFVDLTADLAEAHDRYRAAVARRPDDPRGLAGYTSVVIGATLRWRCGQDLWQSEEIASHLEPLPDLATFRGGSRRVP